MRQHADPIRDFELHERATALTAWAVANDSRLSDTTDRIGAFVKRGWSRYDYCAKAAIQAITAADEAVALGPFAVAFLHLVEGESALGQLDGYVRVGLNGLARIHVGEVTTALVAEGQSKPVMRLDFTLDTSAPTKIEAQIVITTDALRSLDPATQASVRALLVSAVARQTDVALVNVLTAGSSASSSDPAVLLSSISGGNPSRPYLLGGYDALLSLTPGTLRDLRDLAVTIVPTPAAAGTLIALDATGLLVATDETIDVQVARHANVVLDDGGSPTYSTLVSMWQTNLAAIRAERFLRFAVRSGAVAFASTGSPA